MKTGVYKIADTVVQICSLHDEVQQLCAEYQSDEPVQLMIVTSQRDIDFERQKSAQEDAFEGIVPRWFPDEYLETLAVYRKLALALLEQDVLLFHGSVVAVDGQAYLFTAKSGTGKSTHTRLWREKFGSRLVMVNDDKPLIRLQNGTATVYGTPWDGKHRLSTNIAVPLKAVCILERSEQNHIEPVTMGQALPMLFQQAYRPSEKEAMVKTMELIRRLGESVKLYRLGCNMDPEAADVAYAGMQ